MWICLLNSRIWKVASESEAAAAKAAAAKAAEVAAAQAAAAQVDRWYWFFTRGWGMPYVGWIL